MYFADATEPVRTTVVARLGVAGSASVQKTNKIKMSLRILPCPFAVVLHKFDDSTDPISAGQLLSIIIVAGCPFEHGYHRHVWQFVRSCLPRSYYQRFFKLK